MERKSNGVMAQSPRFASQGDPGFSFQHEHHIFVSGEMQEIMKTNLFHSCTCRKTQINDTKYGILVFCSLRWYGPSLCVWLFREGSELLEFKPLCREDTLLTVLVRSRSNLLSLYFMLSSREKKRPCKTLNEQSKRNLAGAFIFA